MVVRTSLSTLLILASTVASLAAEDQMPWVEEYPVACQQANNEGKLVLLHFTSDNCTYCVKLEKNVFSRKDVADHVAKNFVPVSVHASKNPQLTQKYNVRAFPTDVFVTPAGVEVFRTVSPQSPTDYMNLMTSVAKNTGIGAGRDASALPPQQQVAATQTLTSPPLATPAAAAPANSPWVIPQPRDAVAQVSAQANSQAQWAVSGAQATAQQYNQQVQQYGGQAQQYGQQAQQQAQQSAEQAKQNLQQAWQAAQAQAGQTANQTAQTTQQVAQQANQMTQDTTQAAATAAKEVLNKYTTPLQTQAVSTGAPAGAFAPFQMPAAGQPTTAPPAQTLAPNPTATVSASESNPALTPPPASMASGTYPIVMEGFCPVSLLTEGKWKKGEAQFGAKHRRRTFLFASAAHQQQFLADPDRFSPVMVGYDPVKFMQTGELIEGKATFGLTYRKQIYLFTDDASLKTFWQNPRQFTDGLRQAMTQNERGTTIR
ncbi:thioredoxin fold domain-containing protein [Anatilimnocola sp. NA78]|uniref:thioredoxin fold domain-containing protein n=1 Tax=Anatilimnocola sp. NA78 TaxID=3415683 RepID=UPI003CE51960